MPHNTSAALPVREVTGTAVLPQARVKKAMGADEDIGAISAQSVFIITKATELFIQYVSEKAITAARLEAKSPRGLIYKDIANIVGRTDNLEFLSDLVPQTTTWRAHKEKRARETASSNKSNPLPRGQTTLDGRPATSTHQASQMPTITDQEPGARSVNGALSSTANDLVFQHYQPNGASKSNTKDDVEMG